MRCFIISEINSFYRIVKIIKTAVTQIIFLLTFTFFLYGQDGFLKIINQRVERQDGKVFNEITVLQDFSENTKIEDLTDEINSTLKNSKSVKLHNKNITIKYSQLNDELVNRILVNLTAAIEETNNNLSPLDVENVEVYLLPVGEFKSNFKFSLERRGKIFHYLKPYLDINDLSLDCSGGYSFGHNIFLDIPHELTHNALKEIIDQEVSNESDYPRWFEEGLAEFVSYKVSTKLSPCWWEYTTSFTLPEISLNRREVQRDLFNWRIDNKIFYKWLNSENLNEKILWNERTFYGASFQLIRNDFEKETGEKSLAKFLLLLSNYKSEKRKKLQNKEILKLYKNFIGKKFGTDWNLKPEQIRAIVESQSRFIVQDLEKDLPDKNKIKRYKALSVFASTEEQLSINTIETLIEIKKKYESETKKNGLNSTYISLINTAIAVRLKKENFLSIVLDKHNIEKKDSENTKKWKKVLISSSFRSF